MTDVKYAQNNWMRHQTWLIPAIIALIAFIGGVVSNLIATDLDAIVKPYRTWVWAIFGIALITTVVVAIKDARHGQKRNEASVAAPLDKSVNVSVGRDVKGSTIVVGDKNVVNSTT